MMPNDAKLRELILYISERCEGNEPFGKTKLNKILFYSDFIFYSRTGASITGQEYQKQPYGPVAPRVAVEIQGMQSAEDMAVAKRDYFGYKHEKPVALREANLKLFSGEEIAVVEEVIRMLWDRSAREVSDLSHDFIGWQATPPFQTIPYETVFVEGEEPTEETVAYAQQLVQAGR